MKLNGIRCKSCGASIKIKEGVKTVTCPYCNNTYTIDDEYNTTVHSDKTIGKYTFKYHKLGNYFNFLQSRVGFLFFVLLPIMVVFIYQIYDFAIEKSSVFYLEIS